jgi:hypothetical protein
MGGHGIEYLKKYSFYLQRIGVKASFSLLSSECIIILPCQPQSEEGSRYTKFILKPGTDKEMFETG